MRFTVAHTSASAAASSVYAYTWWIVLLLVTTQYLPCIHCKKTTKNRLSPKLEHLYRSKNLIPLNFRNGYGQGQWGPWSEWSTCSRSCGGGITIQSRECVTDPESSNRLDQIVSVNSADGFNSHRHRLKSDNAVSKKQNRISSGSTSSSTSSSCVGHYKRYQFCNRKKCPGSELKDFRSEQCAAFNAKPFMGRLHQWEAFWLVDSATCELKCRPKGERFYATLSKQVIDGTPCVFGVKNRICIAGSCKTVGCDGVIGSDKKLDVCGVCGGDNSTCRIVSGLYTMPQLPYGYNLIATLPKGSCNVNITELLPSRNYLALRYLNGSYILNGNWAINWSGNYEAVGTIFNYQREDEVTKVESITAIGPTQDSVDMMILSQQTNPGVKYEYTLPLTESSGEGRSTLVHSSHEKAFSGTSKMSSGHHRSQSVEGTSKRSSRHSNSSGKSGHSQQSTSHHHLRHREHQRRKGGGGGKKSTPPPTQLVPPVITGIGNDNSPALRDFPADSNIRTADSDSLFAEIPSGENSLLENNEIDGNATKFVWRTSGFSECSRSCGGGSQKSIVVCVKESNLAVVSDHHCRHTDKIPVQTSRCNTRPCPPEWVAGDWGDCSVTCGEGVQLRQITCKQSISANLQITVTDNMCPESKSELTVRKCNVGPCFRWKVGDWEKCSAKCGRGVKRRGVVCVDVKGYAVSEEFCDKFNRPSEEDQCEVGSCASTTWYFSDWSAQCFAECGQGIQSRRVACVSDNHDSKQRCDPSSRPESTRVCTSDRSCTQGKWFTGIWQACSSPCGPGVQKREVICLAFYRGQYKISVDALCSGLEKPITEQPCFSEPCKPDWYTTDWSQCSQSCDTGNQFREARCLDEKLKSSSECDENKRPPTRQSCNFAKCYEEPQRDSGCIDNYHHCRIVVQSRLCTYSYYRKLCCDSCQKHR